MVRLVVAALWSLASVACFEAPLAVDVVTPVADAGFDQRRFLGGSTSVTIDLDGRASCDPQGEDLVDIAWSLVEGPERPALVDADRLRGGVVLSTPGEYLFALRVTTRAGGEVRESAPDYVSVRVLDGFGDDVVVRPPSTDACGRTLSLDP